MLSLLLPDVILFDLFSHWIEPTNLAQLDSSLTNTSSRSQLLSVLSDNNFVLNNYSIEWGCYDWISTRRIKFKVLKCHKECVSYKELAIFINFEQLNTSRLIALDVNRCNIQLASLINVSPMLTKLTIETDPLMFCDKTVRSFDIQILNQLQYFDLTTATPYFTGNGLKYLAENCHSLTEFYLFSHSEIDELGFNDRDFSLLVENNTNLTTLCLSSISGYCPSILFFTYLTRCCPKLTDLSMNNVKTEAFETVFHMMDSLKHVVNYCIHFINSTMIGCSKENNENTLRIYAPPFAQIDLFVSLFMNAKSYNRFEIQNCAQLTNSQLTSMLINTTCKLQYISISNNGIVTFETIQDILKSIKEVKVRVSNCKKISVQNYLELSMEFGDNRFEYAAYENVRY